MAESGSISVRITTDAVSVGEAYAFLAEPDVGATVVFTGTTRQWTGDHETAVLHYEAYVSMAQHELRRLGEEAAARWPIARCYLEHRVGDVAVGETSVVAGVSAAHRAEAFEACRWLIDTLKVHVPIWKRDESAGGLQVWSDSANRTS